MIRLKNTTAAAGLAVVLLTSCSRSPEKQEARFMARGKAMFENKEYPNALLEFRNASQFKPKDAEPYYQAALVLLAMGDQRMAYAGLLRATELQPGHQAAQSKIAELIGSSVASIRDPQQLEDAEKRIQSILAIVPDSPEALSALGFTEYLLGKPEDGVKHLQTVLELFPQNLQAARTLAYIKLNQKDFPGAEQVLRKAVEDSPKSSEAELALGRFFLLMDRPKDAEDALRKGLSIDPKYGPALLDLVRLQLATGQKEEAEKDLVTLSSLPDKEYRPLHAIFLFQQGRHDEALKEFERQAAENPSDRQAFERLISAYFFTKRFPDAERAINASLKKNSKNTNSLLERSRLYLLTAKSSEAAADLNEVLKAEPNSGIAHYLLSKVFVAQGQQGLRQEQLGQALEKDPGLLAARLELAQILIANKASKDALDLLTRMPASQQNVLPVVVERNWAFFGVGNNTADLRKSIDGGMAMYRQNPDLILQDGLLKFMGKDLNGARKAFEQVLSARPEDTVALDSLAKTYVFEKQPALAAQTIQDWASQHPKSARIQSFLGNWLALQNRRDEARKAFNAAIAADPSFVQARIGEAYVEMADGKLEAARQMLLSVPDTPSTRLPCELGLAQVEEKAAKPTAAIPHYRKALEIDSNNTRALNGLAYDLANDTDQLDEALKYAQKAMELDPSDSDVEDTIGWAYYRKGLYPMALEHLRSAVARGGSAVSKYHLAMAYLETGDKQQGAVLLQQARTADPNLPEAAVARRLFASMSSN